MIFWRPRRPTPVAEEGSSRAVEARLLLGGSAWGWDLVGALAAFLALAVVAAWIQASYLRVNIPASISFPGYDGWCRDSMRPFGVHCWSDYGAIHFDSLSNSPLTNEVVYPASTRILRIPFWIVESIGGYRAGLVLFISVITLCMLVPALWAVRDLPLSLKPVFISIACVATAPFLSVIDRGNMIAFAAPAFLLYLLGLVRAQPWLATGAVIVASSVKPQFAILGLALVALRYWKPALVAIIGSIGITILPFFLFFHSRGLNVLEIWITRTRGWAGSQALSVDWPTNLSLPRVVSKVSKLLVELGSRVGVSTTGLSDAGSIRICVLVSMMLIVVILFRGRRLHPFLLGTIFLIFACLASPISNSYYGLFLIPLVAVIFRLGPTAWPTRGVLNIVITSLMSIGIILGLSPLVIPMSVVTAPYGDDPIVASLLPILSSFAWALLLVMATVKSLWAGESNHHVGESNATNANINVCRSPDEVGQEAIIGTAHRS